MQTKETYAGEQTGRRNLKDICRGLVSTVFHGAAAIFLAVTAGGAAVLAGLCKQTDLFQSTVLRRR